MVVNPPRPMARTTAASTPVSAGDVMVMKKWPTEARL
jgi:hypothetical protein